MTDRDQYLEYFVQNETNIRRLNPVNAVQAFGMNVARLRTEMGFTQKELSKMTGINESTLVRIELGNIQRINMIDASKLSIFFRMPLIKMIGEGDDLMSQYTHLIRSSARTQRLVNSILQADLEMQKSLGDKFDPSDMITKITFSEPVKDGINTTRFLFEHDNISPFRNYPWYKDAYAMISVNSTYYHPMYHKGDRLVISSKPPENGEIGVYIKQNCFYLRRLITLENTARLERVFMATPDFADLIIDRGNAEDMKGIVKFGTVVAVI